MGEGQGYGQKQKQKCEGEPPKRSPVEYVTGKMCNLGVVEWGVMETK